MISRNDLSEETIAILNDSIKTKDIFCFALRMLNNDFDRFELIDFVSKEFKTTKKLSKEIVFDALQYVN